ncbi:PREDICTED: serpin B3-like, partial [Rhagoletis zephyria]|uniref:serpin B3-like n=1 Tax=Rhagoletis zephyria TaxID=28612 RepID=UPI0008113AB5
MTMTGAQGDTYEEMRSVLRLNNSQLTEPELIAACSRLLHRLSSSPSSSTVLQLASAVALQIGYPILPTFLDIVESDFHSKLFSVNFAGNGKAAIEKINSWAGEKTSEKIPILFEEEQLDKDTQLVLLNALYFKGAWAEKFKKKHTTEEEFTWSEEKKFNVSMMHEELISLRQTTTEEGHQLVELPYRGEVQSMLLFLPNETFLAGNSSTTAATTTTTITSAFYRAIKKHKALSKMRSKWVDLSLPRFKIESDSFQELKGILQKMGMRSAFEGGVADFSRGMTGGKGLKIAQVVQKTMIE